MRPVQKLIVGTQIIVEGQPQTISETYNPYQSAKKPLLVNFGEYCSYCEVHNPNQRDLHVEHVQPKGLRQYVDMKTKWSNFLLACSTCNGADNKGDKNVVLSDIHLPHLNNTIPESAISPWWSDQSQSNFICVFTPTCTSAHATGRL